MSAGNSEIGKEEIGLVLERKLKRADKLCLIELDCVPNNCRLGLASALRTVTYMTGFKRSEIVPKGNSPKIGITAKREGLAYVTQRPGGDGKPQRHKRSKFRNFGCRELNNAPAILGLAFPIAFGKACKKVDDGFVQGNARDGWQRIDVDHDFESGSECSWHRIFSDFAQGLHCDDRC
jgi:hypothetical protein